MGHREAKMHTWPDVDGDGVDELLLGLTEAEESVEAERYIFMVAPQRFAALES